jgi:hypothetical protein
MAKGTKYNSGSRDKKGTKKATRSRKRAATESDSEGESRKKATRSRKRATTESDSEAEGRPDDSEPMAMAPSRKKARVAKRKEADEDLEVEEVDDVDAAPPPEVVSDDSDSANINQVSKTHRYMNTLGETHTYIGGWPLE